MKSISNLNSASTSLSYTDNRDAGLVFNRPFALDYYVTLESSSANGANNKYYVPLGIDVIDSPQSSTIYYAININLPGAYITSTATPASNTHTANDHTSVFTFANVNLWNQYKNSFAITNGSNTFTNKQFEIAVVVSDGSTSSQSFTVYVNNVARNLDLQRYYTENLPGALFPTDPPTIVNTSDTSVTWNYTLDIPAALGYFGNATQANSNVVSISGNASTVNSGIGGIYYYPPINYVANISMPYVLKANGVTQTSGSFTAVGLDNNLPAPVDIIEYTFTANTIFYPTYEERTYYRAQIIAGAGGGGGATIGGGGGAGEIRQYSNVVMSATSYEFIVGAGGAAKNTTTSGRAGTGGNTIMKADGVTVWDLWGGQGGAKTEAGVVDGGRSGRFIYAGSGVHYYGYNATNYTYDTKIAGDGGIYNVYGYGNISAGATTGANGAIGNTSVAGGGGGGAGNSPEAYRISDPIAVYSGGPGVGGPITGSQSGQWQFYGNAAYSSPIIVASPPYGSKYQYSYRDTPIFSNGYYNGTVTDGNLTVTSIDIHDATFAAGGAGYSFDGNIYYGGSGTAGHSFGIYTYDDLDNSDNLRDFYTSDDISTNGKPGTSSGGAGGSATQAAGSGGSGFVKIRFYKV